MQKDDESSSLTLNDVEGVVAFRLGLVGGLLVGIMLHQRLQQLLVTLWEDEVFKPGPLRALRCTVLVQVRQQRRLQGQPLAAEHRVSIHSRAKEANVVVRHVLGRDGPKVEQVGVADVVTPPVDINDRVVKYVGHPFVSSLLRKLIEHLTSLCCRRR
jgi:hypothetical protein